MGFDNMRPGCPYSYLTSLKTYAKKADRDYGLLVILLVIKLAGEMEPPSAFIDRKSVCFPELNGTEFAPHKGLNSVCPQWLTTA
jgi:hypothetical protein